jgi:hypothetical protein
MGESIVPGNGSELAMVGTGTAAGAQIGIHLGHVA